MMRPPASQNLGGGGGRGERQENTPKQKQCCFSKNLKKVGLPSCPRGLISKFG